MKYDVRYLDAWARTVREERVDTSTAEEARARLAAQGHLVLSAAPVPSLENTIRAWIVGLKSILQTSHTGATSTGTVAGLVEAPTVATRTVQRARNEVALLCRELAALTSSGLSVVESLEALAAHHQATSESKGAKVSMGSTGSNRSISALPSPAKPASEASVYALLLGRLRAGRALSSALEDAGGFPALLVASVRASERTSNLGHALTAYLHYEDLVGALRRRVVSAAVYPAVVVALGCLITLFLLWVVVPRFAVLYGQMGQPSAGPGGSQGQGASGLTIALLQTSQLLHDWPWLVPAAASMLLTLIVHFSRDRRWVPTLNWIVSHTAPLASQARHFELARLYEALALLTRGGYSLHESFGMCLKVVSSEVVRDRVEAARDRIARGMSVSRACQAAGLTDEVTYRLLVASERGGDFAGILQAIGARHSTAFETFVDRTTRLVEPLLLLGVALLVGGTVVMLYMPIFDIASAIR